MGARRLVLAEAASVSRFRPRDQNISQIRSTTVGTNTTVIPRFFAHVKLLFFFVCFILHAKPPPPTKSVTWAGISVRESATNAATIRFFVYA